MNQCFPRIRVVLPEKQEGIRRIRRIRLDNSPLRQLARDSSPLLSRQFALNVKTSKLFTKEKGSSWTTLASQSTESIVSIVGETKLSAVEFICFVSDQLYP